MTPSPHNSTLFPYTTLFRSSNKDPMPPAKDADAKLTELRKLFFSVIEHLQELIREQGETRDQTSAANGDDEFTRPGKLRSEARTSELQSRRDLVCRLLLEKK